MGQTAADLRFGRLQHVLWRVIWVDAMGVKQKPFFDCSRLAYGSIQRAYFYGNSTLRAVLGRVWWEFQAVDALEEGETLPKIAEQSRTS